MSKMITKVSQEGMCLIKSGAVLLWHVGGLVMNYRSPVLCEYESKKLYDLFKVTH